MKQLVYLRNIGDGSGKLLSLQSMVSILNAHKSDGSR